MRNLLCPVQCSCIKNNNNNKNNNEKGEQAILNDDKEVETIDRNGNELIERSSKERKKEREIKS